MAKREEILEEEYEDKEEYEEEEDEEYEEDDEESSAEMIEKEAKELLREMRKLRKTSEEYMVLSQRLQDLTSAKENSAAAIREEKQSKQIDNQKYAWILPTVCQTLGNIAGQVAGQMLNRGTVRDVIRYEDSGGIVTGKSAGFVQKPRS